MCHAVILGRCRPLSRSVHSIEAGYFSVQLLLVIVVLVVLVVCHTVLLVVVLLPFLILFRFFFVLTEIVE